MDKFWEWMVKEEYAEKVEDSYVDNKHNYHIHGEWVEFEKQMLIGYMIQYLNDTDTCLSSIDINYWSYLYDELKDIIKERDCELVK